MKMCFTRTRNPDSKSYIFSALTAVAIFFSSILMIGPSAYAMKIQKVISPGGIEAWLVEEHKIPLVTMEYGFKGGSSQDPDGKEGLAYLVSGMLDEGAGDLTSSQYQERKEELAFRMGFNAGRDVFTGSFQSLTEYREESFEMLRLALTKARFDQDAVERVRRQIMSGYKFDANNPNSVAAKKWREIAFGDHPYGREKKGDEKSMAAITADDLREYVKKNFTKGNLKVGVVGDIDAKTLGLLLDKVFGDLPDKPDLKPIAKVAKIPGPVKEIIEMDIPQSVVQFGHEGVLRNDPDFVAAYVLNYIIGGGGFSSRLTEEVREKRGLAYSVYTYLSPMTNAGLYAGGVATANKHVNQSVKVIKEVLSDVAKNGPTAEELENAKKYLTGSYALRFDTSPKIASQLLWIQIEDLGMDYIEKRNERVDAITLDDLKRVAKKLLKPDNLIITIVGKPEKETAAKPTKAEEKK